MQYPNDSLIKAVVNGYQANAGVAKNIHYWWLYTTNPSGVSDLQLRTAVANHIGDLGNQVKGSWPGTTRWDSVDIYAKKPTESEFQFVGTESLTVVGQDTTDTLPAGVAATVTGPTSKPRRQARKFLPPFAEDNSGIQQWTALGITRLAAYALKWVTGYSFAGVEAYIFPIALNVVNWTWTALRAARANSTPGYQRRRKPGVGV